VVLDPKIGFRPRKSETNLQTLSSKVIIKDQHPSTNVAAMPVVACRLAMKAPCDVLFLWLRLADASKRSLFSAASKRLDAADA
jgi:hypothetical protein